MSDSLETLEALLPKLPAAADQRRLGDSLTQAVQDLRDAANQTRRLRALLTLADQLGYGATPEQRGALQTVREAAEDVGLALEEAKDEESLKLAVFDYQKSFIPALTVLDRGAREQWSSTVRDRFAPLVAFGELLEKVGVEDLGRRMASCGRRATSVTGGSAEELGGAVSSLLEELARLQAERAEKIQEGEVGEFLNALAERRATLAMITPAVRAFLEGNQALGRFSVSAA
jgi:hypothetical protein